MNTRRINPILYFLIVYVGGIFGIHYFVDGNNKKGVLYLCTLGCCGIGWLIDMVKAFILIFDFSGYRKKNGNKSYDFDMQGRMYTKLRGVKSNCVNVVGLNRQTALEYMTESTPIHLEPYQSKFLAVTDENGIDLGEITYERSEVLRDYPLEELHIAIKNLTGGVPGRETRGCNAIIQVDKSLVKKIQKLSKNAKALKDGEISIKDLFVDNPYHDNLDDYLKRFSKATLPYDIGYISPSGGYANYAIFEVKAKKASTNRLNKRKVSAKNEEEAIEEAKAMDLIAPFDVSVASFEPPSENQLAYAKSLKMKIPNDARASDVSAMLSWIDYENPAANDELAKCADKMGCYFSLMACDKQIIDIIRAQADDKHLAMFYCYVYLMQKKKQPLADMFEDADFQKCVNYANSVCNNEKVIKSIHTCLASAPNINKGTIAYNSAQNFEQ